VAASITHRHSRRPEAHRLVIEQRGQEGSRVVALQPGGLIDNYGKGGCMALGEGVTSKRLQLPKNCFRYRLRDAEPTGSGEKRLAQWCDRFRAAARAERAP
jgi:hypothetical protein